MNGSDILDFVYMLLVGAILGLMWWRLVWAIRRGDKWELTAEYNRLHRQAIELGCADLARELQLVKVARDELLEQIEGYGTDEEDVVGPVDLPF